MKNIITVFCLFFYLLGTAQSFNKNFNDKTLRLDFVFSGNKNETKVTSQSPMIKTGNWYGRKVNLTENNLQGDAEVNVYDLKTNKKIYTQSFSTLYQEWLTQEAAKTMIFTTEQVLLIPEPKRAFKIVINFFENNKPNKVYEGLFDFTSNGIIVLNNRDIKYKQLNESTNKTSPINVAIVAEGFTESEMPLFEEYAKRAVSSLFNHKTFNKYKDQFNIYAVFTESKDSGVSNSMSNTNKNTIAQSSFGTFEFERYLTTSKLFKLHNELAGFNFDHIIIIANTDVYGGGGIYNSYTLTSIFDKTFDEVVVHEFGHSFAGLGDEYFYADDIFSDNAHQNTVEPWVKNNTSLVNFDSKWKNKLPKNSTIPTPYTNDGTDDLGVYLGIEGGKVYIPHQDCRMHTNTAKDFCSVCNDAIEELILHYTIQK